MSNAKAFMLNLISVVERLLGRPKAFHSNPGCLKKLLQQLFSAFEIAASILTDLLAMTKRENEDSLISASLRGKPGAFRGNPRMFKKLNPCKIFPADRL